MKFRSFTVAVQPPAQGQEALNAFCGQHRVVSVEKHFVAQGAESFWAICVTYIDGSGTAQSIQGGKRDRIDYKEVLNEQDFAIYVELRSLRKSLAEQKAYPLMRYSPMNSSPKWLPGASPLRPP